MSEGAADETEVELEDKLRRELQDSGISGPRHPAVQTARQSCIDRGEVGVVEEIECLNPELHVQPFEDVRFLRQCHIVPPKARSDDRSATLRASVRLGSGWRNERSFREELRPG